MKKVFSVFIFAFILIGVVGCGNQEKSKQEVITDKIEELGFIIEDSTYDSGKGFTLFNDSIEYGGYMFNESDDNIFSMVYSYNDKIMVYNDEFNSFSGMIGFENDVYCMYSLDQDATVEGYSCTSMDIVELEALELRLNSELEEMGISFDELIEWSKYILDNK